MNEKTPSSLDLKKRLCDPALFDETAQKAVNHPMMSDLMEWEAPNQEVRDLLSQVLPMRLVRQTMLHRSPIMGVPLPMFLRAIRRYQARTLKPNKEAAREVMRWKPERVEQIAREVEETAGWVLVPPNHKFYAEFFNAVNFLFRDYRDESTGVIQLIRSPHDLISVEDYCAYAKLLQKRKMKAYRDLMAEVLQTPYDTLLGEITLSLLGGKS